MYCTRNFHYYSGVTCEGYHLRLSQKEVLPSHGLSLKANP